MVTAVVFVATFTIVALKIYLYMESMTLNIIFMVLRTIRGLMNLYVLAHIVYYLALIVKKRVVALRSNNQKMSVGALLATLISFLLILTQVALALSTIVYFISNFSSFGGIKLYLSSFMIIQYQLILPILDFLIGSIIVIVFYKQAIGLEKLQRNFSGDSASKKDTFLTLMEETVENER